MNFIGAKSLLYFETQSDTGKDLPHIAQLNPNTLSQLETGPNEIKPILETLQTGKASSSNKINNYVLLSLFCF